MSDPATQEWREALQRRLDERCTKLAEVMAALAASQQDLTRVERERDELAGHLEGSRRVAADLMRERDEARHELDQVTKHGFHEAGLP